MRHSKIWVCGLVLLSLVAGLFLGAYFRPVRSTSSARRPTPPPMSDPGVARPVPAAALSTKCPFLPHFDGSVGIYAKNLETGRGYTLNADKVFAAASTIKVPVSVVIYQQFYDQADFLEQIAYDIGVELMMVISDNEYFAVFLDEIEEKNGPEKIRKLFDAMGMVRTTLRDPQARNIYGYSNITTAQDMAVFFEQLYRGRLISAEKTNFMLDAMSQSIFPDELARYIQNRRVIHKIGELDSVLADVGIVEGPGGSVLISVFTETELEQDYASNYIAAASACLYTALSGDATAWNGEVPSRYEPSFTE